ncbi:STAS domain-containing protein [Petroclostridium sp. X23]|uniref:STAS domain-containing protein n=1 Tax=Petroclostridium sp. X23 TaxID=3045146 RepID=UPI0024AD38BE|nr:STAS domain-containing protein [Petroclostridium sp. X23]WHH61369.1 STAS domain-containing protein [Petroclostridium sp. X23]
MNSIPLIFINKILIISLQGDINDKMALSLQQSVLDKIYTTGAKGILLDISLLDIVDSYLGRIITETVKMVQLLGAKAVLTGMKPYVAITLVELGLDIDGVEIALNADLGIKILEDHIKAGDIEEMFSEDLDEQGVD